MTTPTTTVAADAGPLAEKIGELYRHGTAAWVDELGIEITSITKGEARFTLPVTPALCHGGGVLCGQTMMTCIDSGMLLVMWSLTGGEPSAFTTVNLNTSFERAVPETTSHVNVIARCAKPGRTLVFGEVDILLPNGKRAAHGTTSWMWLQPPQN